VSSFPVDAGVENAAEGYLRPKISSRTPALTAGVFLVLAVVAANATFSYRAIRQLAGDQQWVVHTQEVMGELQTILAMVTDAETAHRGFLLTGNPSFLEPFRRQAGQISSHIDRLQELTRDNPLMQPRIPFLRRLVQEKMASSQASIDSAARGDHNAARGPLASGAAEQTLDQIRQLIAKMLGQENDLLDTRTRAARQSLGDAVMTFSVASLFAVVFVAAFYVVAKREVRQRVKEARAAEEREQWLNITLSSIGDAVIATDAKGVIQFMNRAGEKLIGGTREECGGRPIAEVFRIFDERGGGEAPNPVEKVLGDGATVFDERILLRNLKDEEVPIEDSAAPILGAEGQIIGAVLVFRDLTSRRMAQESARRSEKLAASGRLAATIAHEINNPLEAATNFIYLAKNSATLEDSRRYLSGADLELARAAHITRKALSFYRDSSRPVMTNIATVLDELLAIYGGRIRGARVKVNVESAPDIELWTLRGELVQIISNLISNALDALHPGGVLVIRARKAAQGAAIEVEDNGEGIPRANLDKIFDAFFTTKKDIGTGLGLWVVRDLLQKQGGTIGVDSRTEGPHRGTKFSLYLPSLPVPAPVPLQERKAS
jgi:PAS domain S-box-containing protein